MAKTPYSKKGRQPAKSAKTTGGSNPDGPKGTAKAPLKLASGQALSMKAVIDFRRKGGAVKDLIASVARLQQKGTPAQSSPTPEPDRK